MKTYTFLFFLLLATDIAALATGWQAGHFVFKFLLMPVLITALLQHKKAGKEKNWRLVFAGLIMAWAGDVLLLFAASRPLFFILGLICFLCTHLAYIVYFNRYHKALVGFISARPLLTSLIFLYAGIFIAILWPGLGTLLVPVIVYTLVISVMVLQAFAAGRKIEGQLAVKFIAGAMSFVVSDSLLAFDKFYQPFAAAGILVMVTYGAAQWLIVSAGMANTDTVLTRDAV